MKNQLIKVIESIRNKTSFFQNETKDSYDLIKKQNIDSNDLNDIERRYLEIIKKYSYEELSNMLKQDIIVSFTSFPYRINTVHIIVEDLLKQTKKPDKIILWLAEEEFPNKENDLPNTITELINNNNLTVKWCNNLRAHKKYFYCMKEYPNDIIITVDDDIRIKNNTVELLFLSYLEYPNAISTIRSHIMLYDSDQKELFKYNDWVYEQNYLINQPSMHLFATNGAGSLFPASILPKEYLDEELIKSLCLNGDDLWLKTLEIIGDIPTVQTYRFDKLSFIPGTQEESLYKVNNKGDNNNDTQIQNIIDWTDEIFEKDYLINRIMNPATGTDLNDEYHIKHILSYYLTKQGRDKLYEKKHNNLQRKYNEINKKYNNIVNSKLYKILNKIRKIKNITKHK